MLLGTLNIVSGLLPPTLYGIYDRRKVYPPLYNIIYGRYATAKGELEAVRHIAAPMRQEMRQRWEKEKAEYARLHADWEAAAKKERGAEPKEPPFRTPFVSANSSAAAVYRGMDANGGWGVMFETEADTLTSMLSKSEYGDYSDLLRKAHHHEAVSMVRVADRLNIEIEEPRLSVLLTCTGSQLPLLLSPANVANGLASRFLFYALPDAAIEFRDVFAGGEKTMAEAYDDMGRRLLSLCHALEERGARPLQFVMSDSQQRRFLSTFGSMLKEQFAMLGNGIQGFVFRLALECYRYAMTLTALRRMERAPHFDADEQALTCDERDFATATTIVECLVNHTARVFAVLAAKEDDPFARTAQPPSAELKRLYDALPSGREFAAAEAIEAAKGIGITRTTVFRLLGDMTAKYLVLSRTRRGVYRKA